MRDELRWFDRTMRQKPRKLAEPEPVDVEVEYVECSGRCRKGAVDPSCQLHGRGGKA